MESGEARIRKRHWRRDATNRCCICASWFGWMQRYHSIQCCGAGCPTCTTGGIMRTLQASLILNDDGNKVIFRQFGGESSLRTLQSGHTATRADQFDPDGWQLPEITELCQNNDEGRATNYMSVIAHMYQRPRGMDDDTPTGDHDPASTRSCRPRQKRTSNGDRSTRSHPTNFPTSLTRFESGKPTHGPFQNHERDVRTSPRLRPSTDCDPEVKQKCDVLQT